MTKIMEIDTTDNAGQADDRDIVYHTMWAP